VKTASFIRGFARTAVRRRAHPEKSIYDLAGVMFASDLIRLRELSLRRTDYRIFKSPLL
jgi:hypothetical protein